jgi:hypothetical protein
LPLPLLRIAGAVVAVDVTVAEELLQDLLCFVGPERRGP